MRGKHILLSNAGLSRNASSLLMSEARHIAPSHGNRLSNGERAGCADQAHLAQTRHKPMKTHDRTKAHIACFYLALLIGRVSADLLAIVVSPCGYDNILRCSLRHAAAHCVRVPMRRALLRAHRRGVPAAHWQRPNRRGAFFHRTDGASSQAFERGPAIGTVRRGQDQLKHADRVRCANGPDRPYRHPYIREIAAYNRID